MVSAANRVTTRATSPLSPTPSLDVHAFALQTSLDFRLGETMLDGQIAERRTPGSRVFANKLLAILRRIRLALRPPAHDGGSSEVLFRDRQEDAYHACRPPRNTSLI
jgi:hypothetical protein